MAGSVFEQYVVALYEYSPDGDSPDDLALKVDTFYGVVKMPEPDWYLGQELTEDGVRVGKTGIFPANYVEAVADEEELVRLNAGGKGGTKPVQAKLSIAATEVRTEPLAQSASKKADKPAAKKGGGGVATRGGGGDKKAWSPVTMAERQLPMKDCCGAMYTRKSSQFGLYAHFLTMNAAQIWIIVGAVAMLWAIPLCDNSGQYGRYLCGDDAIPADLAYHIDQFTMDGPLDGPKSPPFITPSRLPKSVITAMDGINTRDTLNIKTSFTQSVGPSGDGALAVYVFDLAIGGYTLLMGIVIWCLSKFLPCGYARRGTSPVPFKGMMLFVATLPTLATFPTFFGGILMVPSIVLASLAALRKEVTDPPRKRSGKKAKKGAARMGVLTFCHEKIGTRFYGKNREGREARVVFLIVYAIATIGFGLYLMLDGIVAIYSPDSVLEQVYVNKKASESRSPFTIWVPLAKFFGGVMDVNFGLILFPVSFTFISFIYRLSLKDKSCLSRTVKFTLKYLLPLDQSIKFHKLCGLVGFYSAFLHTACHLMNFAQRPSEVWRVYRESVWITGTSLLFMSLLMMTGVVNDVKRNHHEIFQKTHLLFMPYLIFALVHGKNWLFERGLFSTYFQYWFAPAAFVYVAERLYRSQIKNRPVTLASFTHMSNKVITISVDQVQVDTEGCFRNGYKMGQYAWLRCPALGGCGVGIFGTGLGYEWHPFTISSAPQERYVTFHIRVQGPGSWTEKLSEFLEQMQLPGRPHTELSRRDQYGNVVAGKILAPNGLPFFRIFGPISAPTQYLVNYNQVMVCAAGIGVTPLAASMKSILNYRWRYHTGKTFPDQVDCYWVCSYRDLKMFRWFVRTIREVEDTINDITYKNPESIMNKYFQFHLFVTSFKDGQATEDTSNLRVDDVAFWGQPGSTHTTEHEDALYTEVDLYRAMVNPTAEGVTMGNIHIQAGRPDWDKEFESLKRRRVQSDLVAEDLDIGVSFCGNPFIAKDITTMCNKHYDDKAHRFHFHKEVF